jgi:hypothetical protein
MTDSLKRVVVYQNPGITTPWPVRNWTSKYPQFSGSMRKYLTAYTGSVTHNLLRDALKDLADGGGANDPTRSKFFNALQTAVKDAYNTHYGIAMDWFHIDDPATNIGSAQDAFAAAGKLLLEWLQTDSVTFGGQFRLDIQTGDPNIDPTHFYMPPPDPRPVFDWSVVLAANPKAYTLSLTIDVKYDHMESNNAAEVFLGAVAAYLSAGLAGPILATALGVEVANQLTQDYNATAGHQLLDAIGNGWGNPNPFTDGPLTIQPLTPSQGEFKLVFTWHFTPTTWDGLYGVVTSVIPNLFPS